MSNRIVIEIDQEAMIARHGHPYPVSRAVVRSDKIVGLVETIEGFVELSIKTKEDAPVVSTYILNSFDEVADFMTK